jgi:hypothetical protein
MSIIFKIYAVVADAMIVNFDKMIAGRCGISIIFLKNTRGISGRLCGAEGCLKKPPLISRRIPFSAF